MIAAAKPVGTRHNGENSENVHVSNRRISSNAVAGSAVDQQTKTVQAHKSSFTTPQVVDYYADLGVSDGESIPCLQMITLTNLLFKSYM